MSTCKLALLSQNRNCQILKTKSTTGYTLRPFDKAQGGEPVEPQCSGQAGIHRVKSINNFKDFNSFSPPVRHSLQECDSLEDTENTLRQAQGRLRKPKEGETIPISRREKSGEGNMSYPVKPCGAACKWLRRGKLALHRLYSNRA